jgi:multiple sugar transport system ATP-binding protein
MSTVEFRDIVKRYGALTILERLNLKVEDGEFLVLLGPSGCGKTTLLNLLAGLLEINDGAILIDGRDVSDLDPKDRGLAMVFQSYALYPTKTVRGNLKFGLSARRLSGAEIENRIAWAAKLLQIEHLLDRKPAQLSGGQRQRVAIGRALVKQVGLFLFDEPLSNLDAKLRTEMRLEIKKLHTQLKSTIVYVTHDQIEAMTMATKIAVMDKGVIQQLGSPDEIYDLPENVFVADFVGAPTMNMVDGVIRRDNGAVRAELPGTEIRFDLSAYKWRESAADRQPVKIGFRSEHFAPADEEGPAGPTMPLELPIQFVEKSGAEAVAFLDLAGKTIAARIEPGAADRYRRNATAAVKLQLDKVNVFDAGSGRRL